MLSKIQVRKVIKTKDGKFLVFYRMEKIIDRKKEFVAVDEPIFLKNCLWEEGQEVIVPIRVSAEVKKNKDGEAIKRKNGELMIVITTSVDTYSINEEDEG